MKWQNDLRDNYTEDPGFRKARYIFVVMIILAFTMIIWYGKNVIRIPEPRTLVIYCYSGMQVVMEKAIFPIFKEYWFEQKGEKLEFIATFAGSGEITNKVLKKFPAEVAVLSSKLDVWHLSTHGISAIRPYNDLPYLGIVARTPLVMLVDKNNLNIITNYIDLKNAPGKIILPDPVTSGAGQLSILSIYGSARNEGNTGVEAIQVLKNVWHKIDVTPSCAREALESYKHGKGNILITYEANLLTNPKHKAVPGHIEYPRSTIICEPIAISIERNIVPKQKELVNTFIQFLWSPEVQKALVDYGFQSVDKNLNISRTDFGYIQEPFTIDSLESCLELKKIIDTIVLESSKQ